MDQSAQDVRQHLSLSDASRLLKKIEVVVSDTEVEIEHQKDNIEKLSGRLEKLSSELNQLKETPESFKGKPDYEKLSKIIEKAEKYDRFCQTPETVAKDAENDKIEKLIELNYFRQLLDNPEIIFEEGTFKNCKLTDAIRKGSLFDEIKSNPGLVIANEELADTALSRIIKAFQKFEKYKNYWNNLLSPLLNTLCQLSKNDEVYNTRALLFYAAQLYSISCIMNEIHSGNTSAERQHQANVSVFNNATAPFQNELGIPATETSLNDFEFQYENAPGEVEMINYLKKYKPLPFIFINSFYSDRILSDIDS
ncbi:MAG: hypothetical protein IJ986_06795 [Bacteroidales bacterium]|nr:hypothetical protein [Bacteroidales bacterium]